MFAWVLNALFIASIISPHTGHEGFKPNIYKNKYNLVISNFQKLSCQEPTIPKYSEQETASNKHNFRVADKLANNTWVYCIGFNLNSKQIKKNCVRTWKLRCACEGFL